MASIRTQGEPGRPDATWEIRECRATPNGPRQFTLARFKRVLTPEVLDEARARAQRPFDRAKLVAAARARGIPVGERPRSRAARALLAELRAGRVPDPTIVTQLREALAALEARPLPEHLADAAEWVGQPEAARGKALRGLLRAASRIARSRGALRPLPQETFPRFHSTAPGAPTATDERTVGPR